MVERIATRERCGLCLRVSAVGFWVPNEVWAAVVHPSRLQDIHCLACFADHADAAMVDWAKDIKFYPVSLVAHLRGDDPSDRGMLDPSDGSAETEGPCGLARGHRPGPRRWLSGTFHCEPEPQA